MGMIRYAVEARIFNHGKIVAKVREAGTDEENGCRETRTCDIWVDVFDTQKEAEQFCAGYKKA